MTFPEAPIVPIVVIDSADDADPLADALLEGGIGQVEITLRTPAAMEAVRRMARHSGLTVGIGTALTPAQVDEAADLGAAFVVSPGLIDPVVERTVERGLIPVPGVATPTELARATASGLGLVKLFPAEQLGGVGMISALSAVFAGIRFMPSGGIGPENAREYLDHPSVAAIGGSWMAPRDAIRAGDFAGIAALCRRAVELAR